MTNSKAVQHSDQMVCECGNVWDMNDPDPPHCNPPKKPEQKEEAHALDAAEASRLQAILLDRHRDVRPVNVGLMGWAAAVLERQAEQETACDTCHGQGEVWTGETQSFGYMSMQPPGSIMESCPECSGDISAPDVSGLVEALEKARRELNACQRVIHYAGGFDPAYVEGAHEALAVIDAALSAHREQGVEQNPTEREALEVRFSTDDRTKWTVKDWYSHFGAWENDKGQLCFGSTIAFATLLERFHLEIARQCALSAYREQQGGDTHA